MTFNLAVQIERLHVKNVLTYSLPNLISNFENLLTCLVN